MKRAVNINKTLFTMPVACISVGSWDDANIITLAYVGKVCMNPPIIAIGVHPARYSHKFLMECSEFVINIPTIEQAKAMDGCGTFSGRNIDKWDHFGLTKEKANVINTPMIKEFPFNMECKIVGSHSLGSHTIFLGEVVANHVDEKYLKDGTLKGDITEYIIYIDGKYYEAEGKRKIGVQGFSKKE